jgi:putative ABC transport system substrate-binding protein
VRRREFITLLGSAAAAWPVPARAQRPATPVIGYLGIGSRESDAFRLLPFRQGLGETGYAEGRNVTIEYRWAEYQNDRLPALAADLVRRQVTVIAVPGSTAGALAAKTASTTIPIVFAVAVDPVAVGLVASLNRPGGNLTGAAQLGTEVGPKRLELLRELVPTVIVIALLVNPSSPIAETTSRDLRAAARILGLQLHVLHATTETDFETVFARIVQLRAGALVIGVDSLFTSRAQQLAALTVRHAVPAIYSGEEFVAAGGLVSYGGGPDSYRQVGIYSGRILNGEKPADLPVTQSTKVPLIINLKTAKALGIVVSLPLLGRADAVIE